MWAIGDGVEGLWATHCVVCDQRGLQLCAACAEAWEPRAVSTPIEGVRAAVALVPYDSATGDRLRRAKYGADRPAMVALGEALAERLAPWLARAVDAVVPVPSAWPRRARRGFAPAAVLARPLARRLGRPLVHALSVTPGRASVGLGAGQRAANLRGRVRAARPVPGRVVLVDDVVTTGATAAACARELLGTQTREVVLAALCATERREDTDGSDTV